MIKLPVNMTLTWTLLASFLLSGLAGTMPLWAARVLPEDIRLGIPFLCGLAASVPMFIALCFAVRCKRCRYKLFWHAIAKIRHPIGLHWFISASSCPNCGAERYGRSDSN